MKKTRTIEMIRCCIHYRGVCKGYIVRTMRTHFKLPCNGKVKITIKEKGPYRFTPRHMSSVFEIHKDFFCVGIVCGEEFIRLFFKPDEYKNYDIIVKEVK